MSLEDLAANIDQMTVGLDDTFQFHCTQCGLCCLNREDILLSPMDIFRISKELKLTPTKFFAQYCEAYIGDNTRIPIVRLQPVGEERRCPLLKNHKCSVHNADVYSFYLGLQYTYQEISALYFATQFFEHSSIVSAYR